LEDFTIYFLRIKQDYRQIQELNTNILLATYPELVVHVGNKLEQKPILEFTVSKRNGELQFDI